MTDIQMDVIYATKAGRSMMLDIYRPNPGESTHTAVLLLHGGAWRMGDKSMMEIFGLELARLGFVAVAPEYRLLGEAPWPAQLEDVKTAIGWVRANADSLDIDPDRIVLQGFSAGGHLALMAAGTPDRPEFKDRENPCKQSDRVAAVVAFFPPIEFSIGAPCAGQIPAENLLGESATAKEAQKAGPLFYVSKDYPPTFLLHGTADNMVPPLTSRKMFNALSEKGVAVELHLYPNHTHEFVRLPSMLAPVQAEIALFLKRTVVDPEFYVQENLKLNMFAGMKD